MESTRLTLLFKRNGGVMIKESVSSPGTSVSNTLGGSFMHSLKSEFYKTETAETVADKFSPALRDAILNDGRFADFIRRSAGHKIYAGKN